MTPAEFVERSRALLAEYDAGPPPAHVLVPNVVGLAQTDANAAIIAAGLIAGTVYKANSGTVAAGLVISQTPASGTSVALGSPVAMTISLGVGTGCPVVANMPGKGVQWHQDYPSPYPANHARSNLKWLLGCYGTSWAWAYLVRSASGISNDIMTYYGSDEGGRMIATFTGQGNFGPAGMLIPTSTSVKPGPVLTSLHPLCSIPLPYPDDTVA